MFTVVHDITVTNSNGTGFAHVTWNDVGETCLIQSNDFPSIGMTAETMEMLYEALSPIFKGESK